MCFGRGHFQGSVEAHSHGTTPIIREVAHEGEVQFSSANAIEAGEHEEGAPEGHSKEQSGVHPGCNLCPLSGSRSHSFVFVARGSAEGEGHVWEAREPSPGGRKSPKEGRASESEGRTIGGSPPVVWCGQSRCRANQSRFGNGERSMSCSPCWGTSRFLLKIRRTCPRTRSETTVRCTSRTGVAQGLADLERFRAPVATARPEEEVGNNIEELAALRREVDQLRRERDVWLGKSKPLQSMDTSKPGILESRSIWIAALIDEADARRSRCKAKMRRPSIVVRKRISMYGLRGVRVGEASNPGPGRVQRRGRVSSSSADAECDPTLLDDLARDLGADVTQRDSSPWSVIPVGSQAVLADGDQHDDTLVDPIWPTEQDANSTAVDSGRQESDTESVFV